MDMAENLTPELWNQQDGRHYIDLVHLPNLPNLLKFSF